MPHINYKPAYKPSHNTTRKPLIPIGYKVIFGVAAILTAMYTVHLYARPIPALTPSSSVPASARPDKLATINWPAFGESSVGIAGRGFLASSTASKDQKAYPTASVAKLMTALAVLDKKPLTVGDTGPMLTISQADVDIYNDYVAKDGSVAAVQLGEQISEYDALEALLLPSANNLADSLAAWAFGSVGAYCDYANSFAKSHGMLNSNFADASGYSPNTVSSANDLLQLGLLARANPVIAEIAAKPTASIPVAGTVNNVNFLLGKNGINGLKTGNTDQAGGVFVASADREIDGQKVTLVASVVHGPDLFSAMRASVPLLDATAANLEQKTIAKAGQSFGTYTVPWQKDASGKPVAINAIAAKDVSTFVWKGDTIKTDVNLKNLNAPQAANASAGTATVTINGQQTTIPLIIKSAIPQPGPGWRINR